MEWDFAAGLSSDARKATAPWFPRIIIGKRS
jgi:hypothetical protein